MAPVSLQNGRFIDIRFDWLRFLLRCNLVSTLTIVLYLRHHSIYLLYCSAPQVGTEIPQLVHQSSIQLGDPNRKIELVLRGAARCSHKEERILHSKSICFIFKYLKSSNKYLSPLIRDSWQRIDKIGFRSSFLSSEVTKLLCLVVCDVHINKDVPTNSAGDIEHQVENVFRLTDMSFHDQKIPPVIITFAQVRK